MDWQDLSTNIIELSNISWQAAQFPELRLYPSAEAWTYDIICSPFPRLSRKAIPLVELQQELIGAIASLQLAYAKKKKAMNREKQMKQYEAATKGRAV